MIPETPSHGAGDAPMAAQLATAPSGLLPHQANRTAQSLVESRELVSMEGVASTIGETSAFLNYIQEQFVSDNQETPNELATVSVDAAPTLKLLATGELVVIQMQPKSMLDSIINGLTYKTIPDFKQIKCGKNKGVRFVLNIDASSFGSMASMVGDGPSYYVGLGQPSSNIEEAQNSAVTKVLHEMEENQTMKITDFSSRVVDQCERNYTQALVHEATSSLEFIIGQLEKTVRSCNVFCVSTNEKKMNEIVLGNLTQTGYVYATAVGPVQDITVELHGKLEEMKEKISVIHTDLYNLISTQQILGGRDGLMELRISCKDVLDYVLHFLGLPSAAYANEEVDEGRVISSVSYFIPKMDIYKYWGNLKSKGIGNNISEAQDSAAFEALFFMENNFRVKIEDHNYIVLEKRKKYECVLAELLGKVILISEEVKLYWGRLSKVIEFQGALMNFDPTLLFSTGSSECTIQAYRSCSAGLEVVIKQSTTCDESCRPHFQKLDRIQWHLVGIKRNVPR